MVDEYKRARRDLQTIFFSLPNILVICVGYSLTVKNIHTKKHFFRAKKARRRNVVSFPLKRGNKKHLQKLCVQVHIQHSVCTIFYNEIFNDSFIVVPAILYKVLYEHKKGFSSFLVFSWILFLIFQKLFVFIFSSFFFIKENQQHLISI